MTTTPTLATDPIGWHAAMRTRFAALGPDVARREFAALPVNEQDALMTALTLAMPMVMRGLTTIGRDDLKDAA